MIHVHVFMCSWGACRDCWHLLHALYTCTHIQCHQHVTCMRGLTTFSLPHNDNSRNYMQNIAHSITKTFQTKKIIHFKAFSLAFANKSLFRNIFQWKNFERRHFNGHHWITHINLETIYIFFCVEFWDKKMSIPIQNSLNWLIEKR